MALVDVDDDAGIRTITLNRPASLNAIDYDLLDELDDAIERTHRDAAVRVVVLRGAGRAFCAGDDLTGMGTARTPLPEDDPNLRAELGYPRFILALRRLPKPVIAQVHGYAMGAGCDLALACDLVYAAEGTRFGLVFARRGMVSGTTLLPAMIGYHRACELLFTGRDFDAAEAHRLGLVNEVVVAENLAGAVTTHARRLAEGPTMALGLIKRAVNQSVGASLDTAVEIQRHTVAASYRTHDYAEGRRAFAEHRAPRYEGR